MNFDAYALKTPFYVVDEARLLQNLRLLQTVARRAGCKILLAQKAFSRFSLYPLMGRYLAGTAASGLYEAKLGREEMGGETHVFSTAYRPEEFDEILQICDHVVFNSASQWQRYRQKALASGKQLGLRINPECSTQTTPLYDPCAPGSRLGITAAHVEPGMLKGISGLHFHTLCEQGSDALALTLAAVEEKFGHILPQMQWVNFGGGHHITRPGYDVERLVRLVSAFGEKYGVQVYLEPGEAVALNAGFLVSTVLDVFENGGPIAILDTSAACHMPDVLEMPYRPGILGAGRPGEKPFSCRLGGPTCLAGDVVGEYSFERPLRPGDRLVFCDMASYTMVKNNTFNGMPLPSIALANEQGALRLVKEFGYQDFKQRLS
ncbi:MAG: carboxynorspermidine decarboxylase [Oscillospiraceae bacterium]